MKQQNFTDLEYANRRVRTRREKFLEAMDGWIPWDEWTAKIRPYYPSGKKGRKPRDLETMLRMYFLQQWYGLSSAAIEEAINDSYAMRSFMRMDFMSVQVPDASTLLKFRRIMADSGLGAEMTGELAERIRKEGFILHRGRILDAFLTARPSGRAADAE